MRKQGISAALLGWLALSGCQAFTAGETVSEPDLGAARKARDEAAHKGHAGPVGAKQVAAEPESATSSHILIRYAGAAGRTSAEITRTKDEAQKLAEEVAKKARAPGASFAALADQYTEDPSGKGHGGKLGTFPKGRMVPTFDSALFALRPGEVSDAVESPFGYHVIYREN